MTEPIIEGTESMIPVLPCVSAEETIAFYEALGFTVTYRQLKPYLYLAFRWRSVDLHFGRPPEGHDPAREDATCLVLVDSVAPYHAAFTAAMRARYGKVLATGRPRITRYRPGATRFSLVDPSGCSIIFIQRDEPDADYTGDRSLPPLVRALDNARRLREFRQDDSGASTVLTAALRKHGDSAAPVDRGRALAALLELAVAMNEPERIPPLRDALRAIPLDDAGQAIVAGELRAAADLETWLGRGAGDGGRT